MSQIFWTALESTKVKKTFPAIKIEKIELVILIYINNIFIL